MTTLKFQPNLLHSIRWTRYCYTVTKEVKNIPWFAPQYYTLDVCDIVTKFLDWEEPYIQFSNNPPNVITIEELQEIIDCAKGWFIESDFSKLTK